MSFIFLEKTVNCCNLNFETKKKIYYVFLNLLWDCNYIFIWKIGIRKISSGRNSLSGDQMSAEFNKDVTRKITESSEYDVTYLSKWRKVPFKIGC